LYPGNAQADQRQRFVLVAIKAFLTQSQITQNEKHYDNHADNIKNVSTHNLTPYLAASRRMCPGTVPSRRRAFISGTQEQPLLARGGLL
jgi:hypothetical protein